MSNNVWHERFAAIADVMRAAYTREQNRDCSAAVLGENGRVIALCGAPLAFGAVGFGARALAAALPLRPGEIGFTNDPACGGTRLTQLLGLAPAHVGGALVGYVALVAHQPTLGASPRVGFKAAPNSLPEVEEPPPAVGPRYEGASIVHNVLGDSCSSLDEGELVRPTTFASTTLPPAFVAQRAAIEKGARALETLAAARGANAVIAAGNALVDGSAELARRAVATIPPGIYAFADSLDDGGPDGHAVVIRLTLTVSIDTLTFDFSDSDLATRGCTNATIATTLAACAAIMRELVPDALVNDGLLAVVDLRAQPGSVVAAPETSATWGGSIETVRRIIDTARGALAQALPEKIPAAPAGTSSHLVVESAGALEISLAGGAGASPTQNGDHALDAYVNAHSIEAIEAAHLVRVTHQSVRAESGGGGVQHGGNGIARELVFLRDATLTLLGDRRKQPPYGLRGGGPGLTAQDVLVREHRRVMLPSKIRFDVRAGDRLVTLTPGGAGDGDPIRAKFWASILSGEPMVL